MGSQDKNDSFSLGFRIQNRLVRTMLIFVGPAQGSAQSDPRQRLKREYERRKALHEQRLADEHKG